MVFEFILKKNNIDPTTDLSIDQSIDFGSTAAAFTGNDADFTVEFEPAATALEAEGVGHVVGMDYVQTHTPEEIAKVIQPQFEETDLETITTIVTRYYEQDTWKSDLIFEKESFDLLQNILQEAGELPEWTPYEDLVNTEFAEEAAK